MEGLNACTQSAISDLSKAPNAEMFKNVVSLEDLQQLYQRYCNFKESIRNGSLGKTAVFWINYMDIFWLLPTYIRATKENNYDLHLNTLFELCPLFFAYNHQNYSRYIPAYLITMLNLSETHLGAEDLLRNNGFNVSRSSVPSSRNPVGITIEQTINRHAKSHGCIIGFSRNYAAYYRWCTTRHSRAKYVEVTLSIADMTSNETSFHRELRQSQIKSIEVNVKKVNEAFAGFTNPFLVASNELYCLWKYQVNPRGSPPPG